MRRSASALALLALTACTSRTVRTVRPEIGGREQPPIELPEAAPPSPGAPQPPAAPPPSPRTDPPRNDQPRQPEMQSAGLDNEAMAARGVINAFLSMEARGTNGVDTLLAPGADFIVTGVRTTTRPRLAGFNGPGDIMVEDASTGLAGAIAWVVVGYRFTGRTPDLAERARATFVLEKQRAGWRIRHVHSSMIERW